MTPVLDGPDRMPGRGSIGGPATPTVPEAVTGPHGTENLSEDGCFPLVAWGAGSGLAPPAGPHPPGGQFAS